MTLLTPKSKALTLTMFRVTREVLETTDARFSPPLPRDSNLKSLDPPWATGICKAPRVSLMCNQG